MSDREIKNLEKNLNLKLQSLDSIFTKGIIKGKQETLKELREFCQEEIKKVSHEKHNTLACRWCEIKTTNYNFLAKLEEMEGKV